MLYIDLNAYKAHERIIIFIVECTLDESEMSYHVFFCRRNKTKKKEMEKMNK